MFQKAIVIDPAHQASYAGLGNLYARQRKFTEARHVVGQALRLRPDDPKSFFNLGLAQEGLGEDEAAIAAFRKAIALKPSYTPAHYNLGTMLLKIQDYHAARQSLSEATRLNPQSSDAWYNLAVADAQLGDTPNALESLKRAVQLAPALAAEAEKDPEFQRLQADPNFRAIMRQGSSRDRGDDEHE